jgi:hypothetical protein
MPKRDIFFTERDFAVGRQASTASAVAFALGGLFLDRSCQHFIECRRALTAGLGDYQLGCVESEIVGIIDALFRKNRPSHDEIVKNLEAGRLTDGLALGPSCPVHL